MKIDPILRSFELLVERDPLAPLVVSPERRATAGDVAALARAAGRLLAGCPLPPGSAVGLAAGNGPGFLASLLALLRAGFVAVLMDSLTPETESLRIVQALGAQAVLRCRSLWPTSPEDWSWTETPPPLGGPPPLVLPEATVVKLTSGSTGAPRGIAASSEALLADDAALTATMGIRPDDRLLATIPLSHSYGLSSLALPALLRGTVLATPAEGKAYDPFATAARTGATVFPTVPAYLDALVRVGDPPERPPSLRLVLIAGGPLSAATSRRFHDLFGLPVHVFYGASECGGICYDREGGAAERGTVGSPVEGVRVTLAPVPGNDPDKGPDEGLVTVSSAAVAGGYLPEGDASLAGGTFTAGDLAAWEGGELALRGRLDGLVNIKGKKVNPREVEAILGQLAGVDEAVVLGVCRPGRPDQVLRAVIACRPGRLSAGEVSAWCREHLAAHKVPRSVILVPEIPRTERGKLDRPALAALSVDNGPA
jgi:long-chain acyl-CoA synthetase